MWAAILGLLFFAGGTLARQATSNNTDVHSRIFLQRSPQLEQQEITTSRTAAPEFPSTNSYDQQPSRPTSTHNPELPERRGSKHRKQNSLNDPSPAAASSSSKKPNIVLLLTDDQDVELGSLQFMPFTNRLLKDEGAEFRHAYVTTPMCCPSRSSLLTGLLVHNHQVFTNNDNCSGNAWQATHETRSFATYLSNNGYRTGYVGKYLNKYNGSYIPPGWREWAGLIMNSRFYNYSINVNGKRIRHGNDYAKDYYSDLIANDSIAFLKQSKQTFSKKPVMLVMSFPAPHGPEDSAPQFSDMFFNVTTHHTQSYNYAPNPDKQWILRVTDKMQPIHKQFTDLLMTKRLQTLQSVDMAVKRVYETLRELGELDNTYIFYTSDHGYHLGQFGLVKGKSFPFEFDVKVPLLVRGPGIEAGTVVDDIVLNVDLAPTFLDLSGEDPPAHMDGRSLMPLLHRSSNKARRKHLRFRQWPDTFLIESSGRREKFGKHANSSSTKTDRLNRECKLPVFQTPCQPRQKWFCVKENSRWRKHKCKHTGTGRTGWKKVNLNRRKCTCFPQSLIPPHSLMLSLNLPEQAVQRNFLRTHLPPSQHAKIMKTGFLKTPFMRMRRSVEAKHYKRRGKRNLMGLLDSFVGGVTKQMQDLIQESNSTASFTSSEIVTVQPNTPRTEAAKCRVTVTGTVNCSRAVYKDKRQWRLSKHDIDTEIAKLKEQLDTLKEIRKHLREKKPHYSPVDEVEEEGESEEDEDLHEEELEGDEEEEEEEIGEDEEEEVLPEENITTSRAIPSTTQMPTTAGPFLTRTPMLHPNNRRTPNNSSAGQLNPANSNGVSAHKDKLGNICICQPDHVAEARRKLKEQRAKKKERKLRRKMRLEPECMHEKMNCFSHDNDHWKTAPLWTEGPFCVCMNANNNTYSCLRTINATHNYLYCEFVTGHITFYNLKIDPFQLFNRVHDLTEHEMKGLSVRLNQLKACRGAVECRNNHPPPDPTFVNLEIFNRRRKPGIR